MEEFMSMEIQDQLTTLQNWKLLALDKAKPTTYLQMKKVYLKNKEAYLSSQATS